MASSMTFEAQDGETVDGLVWRAAGLGPSAVDAVLAANPQLGDVGVFLRRGLFVTIPAVAQGPAVLPQIQLWT